MNAPTRCPDVQALRAFIEGAAAADVAAQVEAHLASCVDCRGIAEGLAPTRKVVVPGDAGWTETAMDSTDPAALDPTTAYPPDLAEVPIARCGEEDAGEDEDGVEDSFDAEIDEDRDGDRPDRSATLLALGDEGDSGEDDLDLTYLLPAARPDTLGRIGDYDVLGVLGQGGMGVVLKAYDSALNRVVAIKVLAPALAGRLRSRRQFLAEARAAAAINHPNVVTIHEVKIQRGMPYLVMEYLGGQTLRQRIHEGPRLRPLELVRIAVQLARGLAAAHEQGVIHRDIKPGNVMLEGDLDRVKITDFGLARVTLNLTEQTSIDRIIGTPAYIPPEVVHGQPVHERSDLFSLGCVIYAMVAGHSPFQGAQSVDMLHKVVALDPPPLHALDPAAPRPLSLLVSQLLEKDPARRPPSAAAVASVLNDLLASLQLRGDRSSWSTDSLEIPTLQAPAPPPTWPTIAASAVAMLLAALLLAVGLQWLSWSESTPNASASVLGLVSADVMLPRSGPVLLVGSSPGARHHSLATAIAAVDQPNTTIRLEPGTYSGSLAITHRASLEGLTIEPAGPLPRDAVLLRGDTPHDATITVEDVANVTLRRLTFDTPPNQFALAVKGSVPGLTIEEIAFRKRPVTNPDDVWSHVWLGQGAHGEPGQPITFRRCAFAPWRAGLVLQGQRDELSINHVNIETCRFDGGSRLIELIDAVQDVRIQGCLFRGGTHGVYLDDLAEPSGRIAIDHNTFYRTEHWVDAHDCSPDLDGMTVTANALLEMSAFDTIGAPLAACRDGGWTLADNQAEGAPTAVGHDLVDLRPRLDVASRDASHPAFLRPVPGSSLLLSGGGPSGYIGALAPARVANNVASHPR